MKRLTTKTKYGWGLAANIFVRGDVNVYNEAIEKLAAYEDTELTPERVTELAQAEQYIIEVTGKIKDCLVTILGASEYIKPGTGVYMTAQIALDCIAKAEAVLNEL